MTFFEEEGLKIKIERGERVFPLSDKSADVLDTLRRSMRRAGAEVHLNTEVKDLIVRDGAAKGLILADQTRVEGDAVIVATGGLSYPVTGSTRCV